MPNRIGPNSIAGLALFYVAYALVATGLLAFNMPPYQNADEVNHLMRADQVSRLRLVGERFDEGRNSGGTVSSGIVSSAELFEYLKFHPERHVTRAVLTQARGFGWDGPTVMAAFANTSIYPPFLYAPSAVAIWIGKLLHIPVIQTLTLARLMTALAAAAVIAWALAVCAHSGHSGAGLWIFSLATLPMSLAVQSACSQDGLMLALAALAGALLARSRSEDCGRGLVPMCICLALIAMARPSNAPLALVPLTAAAPPRSRLLGAACVLVACLSWTGIAGTFAAIDTTAVHGANISAQLRLLMDPVSDLMLAKNTLRELGPLYLRGFIGQLGWLDVLLPLYFVAAACVLLGLVLLAGLATKRTTRPYWEPALVVAAVLLSAGLTLALQYLTWTPVGAPVIDGVQGRYFLPLAFVLAGIASPGHLRIKQWLSAVVVVFPALAVVVTMRAIVVRYYLE